MKQLSLKQCVLLLRVCTLLLVFSMSFFFLISLDTTNKSKDDYNKQVIEDKQEETVLNINKPGGEFNIFSPGDNMISPLLSFSY